MKMTRLQLTAITALRQEGYKATKENVNRIVSSMVLAGATNDSSIETLVKSSNIALSSFAKFKGTNLLSKTVKESEVVSKYKQCGMSCPRCGRPMVLVGLRTRNAAYCIGDCHIALPFKEQN